MRRTPPAADPDAYMRALTGWRHACVESLRAAVRRAAGLNETIKWGHLVYVSNGPVLLIRAEDKRVLLGFWRGQRLAEIEGRLKPGGKYEMATLDLHEGMSIKPATVTRLTRAAVALNKTMGDPTKVVKTRPKPGAARKARVAKAGKTARKKAGGVPR
jgi:hypothetical protein